MDTIKDKAKPVVDEDWEPVAGQVKRKPEPVDTQLTYDEQLAALRRRYLGDE